jgi:hypothetical protein
VALPSTLESILRQKEEELWKNSNISPYKKYIIFPKNPLKEAKNPSRYHHNSIITNLKFQHKPKLSSSFKKPHIRLVGMVGLLNLISSKLIGSNLVVPYVTKGLFGIYSDENNDGIHPFES